MYQKVLLLIGYVTTKLIFYVVSFGYKPNWANQQGLGKMSVKIGACQTKIATFCVLLMIIVKVFLLIYNILTIIKSYQKTAF